jgi:2-keto-3-deoxy-galactonokinase
MRESVVDPDAFARGVKEGAALGSAGSLLNRVFATRTYGLMDKLRDTALSDYLSGLLIGAEIAKQPRGTKSTVIDHRQRRTRAALHRCARAVEP